MSINIGARAKNTNVVRTGKDDRPQTKIWVNVGYTAVNPETGEDVFISTPYGIPLDTMEVRSPGNSQIMQAKNALLEMLIEAASNMAPGEEHIIDDLQVQIRRVSEPEAVTGDTNPYVGTLGKLSFAAGATTTKAA